MEEPKAMLLLIQEFVLAWKQQTNGCTGKAKKLHIFAKHELVVLNKCCTLCLLTARLRHISPAPDVSTSQVLTLVRLRSQPRAEASLRAAVEVLPCEPWKQFLIFLIHVQTFGFECCMFWLTLLSRLTVGWSRIMPLEKVICKWGWSHCWMKV